MRIDSFENQPLQPSKSLHCVSQVRWVEEGHLGGVKGKANCPIFLDGRPLPISEERKRVREIIEFRWSLTPRTLEETGQKFGLTRERVRQIEDEVEEKLLKLIK